MLKVNVDKLLADYNALVEKQEKKLKEIEAEARAYATKRGFDADKTAETIDVFQALENNGLSDKENTKLEILSAYIDEVEETPAEEAESVEVATETDPVLRVGVVNNI